MRQLKILTATMAIRYDCRLVSLNLLHSTLTLCYDTKKTLHDDECARIFAICYDILYDYSHSFPHFDFMLKLLRDSVRTTYKDEEIPEVVRMMFEDARELGEVGEGHKGIEEVKSAYPIDLDRICEQLEAARLDSVKDELRSKGEVDGQMD